VFEERAKSERNCLCALCFYSDLNDDYVGIVLRVAELVFREINVINARLKKNKKDHSHIQC
jgi:hypothetical protein